MKAKGTVKIDAYKVIRRAVEEGVECGVRRAHKHTTKPSNEAITESVEREVMNALCEVLKFDE